MRNRRARRHCAPLFRTRFGIGGCVLEPPDAQQQNWRIRFRNPAPCDLTEARLREHLNLVQSTADELEKTQHPGAEDRL